MVEKTETIRIVAFYGKSWVSAGIRYFTRSKKYSHTAAMMPDGRLIEAWPHGKNRMKQWTDWSDFSAHSKGTKYEIWALPVTKDEMIYCHNRWAEMAANKVPYDYWGVVGFVFKKAKQSASKLFCSEMCIKPSVEINKYTHIDPSLISPAMLVSIIEFSGGYIEKTGIV